MIKGVLVICGIFLVTVVVLGLIGMFSTIQWDRIVVPPVCPVPATNPVGVVDFVVREQTIKLWAERTQGLAYEIGWLQQRLDVLETPEPEPVPAVNPVDVMDSVVHIDVKTEYGSWQGSGVYIGDGIILTAGHVVEDAKSFTITFEDGCVYDSNDYYQEEVSDVGFILLDNSVCHAPIVFDNRVLGRGESVWVLGSPYGTEFLFTVSKGIISNTTLDCDGYFGGKPIFMADAASYPGNSGGPVVDSDGEIIGILVGGYGRSDNLSICIRVDVIVLSLNKYLAQLELERL